jgi:Mrp family chromosome partitioning ATPase
MSPQPGLLEPITGATFHVQPLAPAETQVPAGAYQPLIERLAAMRRDAESVIAAFTSVTPGEGVTYVVESLAWELAKQTGEQMLVTTPDGLSSASMASFGDASVRGYPSHPVRRLRSVGAAGRHWGDSAWQDFQGLRRRFGFVLVDCPALRSSRLALRGSSEDPAARVLSVCRSCDGVVLVVSAGKTQRKDIKYAQSTIQVASANLLGLVLNQRVECVPGLIARFLG